MATALDITKRALKRLNVISASEAPSAADADYCLQELNGIISAYVARGCDDGIEATLANTAQALTLNDGYHQALTDLLAFRIAETFGVAVSAKLASDAGVADRLILKEFLTRSTYGVDSALHTTRMTSTRATWDGTS